MRAFCLPVRCCLPASLLSRGWPFACGRAAGVIDRRAPEEVIRRHYRPAGGTGGESSPRSVCVEADGGSCISALNGSVRLTDMPRGTSSLTSRWHRPKLAPPAACQSRLMVGEISPSYLHRAHNCSLASSSLRHFEPIRPVSTARSLTRLLAYGPFHFYRGYSRFY